MNDPNTLRQDTFTRDGLLREVRIFKVDTKGRLRSGVIYDGKENPLGSTKYLGGNDTDQPQIEELFNRKGQLIRRIFFPGALRQVEFTDRMVTFSFDPGKSRQTADEIRSPVQPITPVTESGQEFTPFSVQISRADR